MIFQLAHAHNTPPFLVAACFGLQGDGEGSNAFVSACASVCVPVNVCVVQLYGMVAVEEVEAGGVGN